MVHVGNIYIYLPVPSYGPMSFPWQYGRFLKSDSWVSRSLATVNGSSMVVKTLGCSVTNPQSLTRGASTQEKP